MKTTCFVMMQSESPILGPFPDQIDASMENPFGDDAAAADVRDLNAIPLPDVSAAQRLQLPGLAGAGPF